MDLIEPIDVTIEQIDKVNTPYPSGPNGIPEIPNYTVRKTAITLPAQVVFGDRDQIPHPTPLGTDEKILGYMVLKYDDLNNSGITLKRGDKVIKMGQIETEVYLSHSQGDPAAHFSGIGGFTLVRMFFVDRNPIG